jgi:hypothetical protein
MSDPQKIISQLQDLVLAKPDLLQKTKNIKCGSGDRINYADQFESLRQEGFALHRLFGKCFHLACFVYYALGDSRQGYTLMRANRFNLTATHKTTHWFVRSPDGVFIDATAEQFDCFPLVDLKNVYGAGRKAFTGFPYLKRGGRHYHEVVPPIPVRDLARRFKEQYGTAYGLDWWLVEEDLERNFM